MAGILKDCGYGLSILRRSPGVAAAAVLSLALGVGANVTTFSLANALLFRPLPVENPDRLAVLTTSYEDNRYNPTSYPDYQDIREHNEAFSDVAAYFFFPMGLTGGDRAEVVMGQLVSWNFFDVLGGAPTRWENVPGERGDLAARAFGGDPELPFLEESIRFRSGDHWARGPAELSSLRDRRRRSKGVLRVEHCGYAGRLGAGDHSRPNVALSDPIDRSLHELACGRWTPQTPASK